MKPLLELKARLETQIDGMIVKIDAEKRGLNTEERVVWNKLIADHNANEEAIKAAKTEEDAVKKMRETIANGKKAHNPNGIADLVIDGVEVGDYRMMSKSMRLREELFKKDPYARAFHSYMMQPGSIIQGTDGISQDEAAMLMRIKNAQSGTVGSQGGFVIPQGFSDNLFEAMLWFGGIEGVVGEFETATGNPWPWPTINDTTNKGRIIGQNVQVTETDFTFNQITFNAYIGSSDLVLIPLALIEDSYFDLAALTARLLGIRLGRLLNQKCTIGSGTAEPTGIVTAAVAAGNILQLAAGNTASITYPNLVSLEHSVDPDYRYNPATRFMFADAMLKLIKLLVDGNNRPLWQPGLTASFREGAAVDINVSRPTILDHPYIINQDMAAPAASQYTMLFGDMNCFKLRRVSGGVTVLRMVERYADYLQVGYTAFMRFDSNLIDAGTHPLAVLQQSAT